MIQVRKATYRGEQGWTVRGRLPGRAWPVSIFTPHSERAARLIAGAVKEGRDWTFAEIHAQAEEEDVLNTP